MVEFNNIHIVILKGENEKLDEVLSVLSNVGFKTKVFTEVENFNNYITIQKPELIIVEKVLNNENGIEVCNDLRNNKYFSDIPIIIIVEDNDSFEKVLCFELGIDDYFSSPLNIREFLAKVKSLLKRVSIDKSDDFHEFGKKYNFFLHDYNIWVFEKKSRLTPAEFSILKILINNEGKIFSRKQLIDLLDNINSSVSLRSIDVHITKIREKLGKSGSLIKNIRSVGYKFENAKNE